MQAGAVGAGMAAGEMGQPASDKQPSRLQFWIILYIGIVAVIFLIAGSISASNHGGFFPLLDVIHGVHVRGKRLDVESKCTLLPFLCLTGLVGCALGWRFRVNMKTRAAAVPLAAFIVGGAFFMSVVLGGEVVNHYLISNGYIYCDSDDYSVGHGKGRSDFRVYVLKTASCPSTPPDQP